MWHQTIVHFVDLYQTIAIGVDSGVIVSISNFSALTIGLRIWNLAENAQVYQFALTLSHTPLCVLWSQTLALFVLLLIWTRSNRPLHASRRYLHVLFLDNKLVWVLIHSRWWLWDWLIIKGLLQHCKLLVMWWVILHFMLLRSHLILCIPVRSLSARPLDLAILYENLLLLLLLSSLFILRICGMIVPVAILIWIIVKRGTSICLKHITHHQGVLLWRRHMW